MAGKAPFLHTYRKGEGWPGGLPRMARLLQRMRLRTYLAVAWGADSCAFGLQVSALLRGVHTCIVQSKLTRSIVRCDAMVGR